MGGTVRPLDVGRKRKKGVMGTYFPTPEEIKASNWCINNNVRISYKPETTGSRPKCWYITINIGPYKKGEKANVSPECYKPGECQKQMYKTCLYYYEKYRK
jgi:hypothetical protein|tara:strand:- start:2191 stop:2493 length:303 start_codon:yes stop_codon:yes gene_type:complete